MAVSYKKLWKLLIEKEMNKTELRIKAGISTGALAKLGKNENVNTEILASGSAYHPLSIGFFKILSSI